MTLTTSTPPENNLPEPARPLRPADLDAVESLVRMLVGTAALGADELLARVRLWEKEVLYEPHQAGSLPNETPGVRARYALIGLLFLTTRITRDAVVDFANYSEQQSNALYRTLGDFARTPVLGILARPMKVGVDAVLRTRDRELERWIRIGRVEERDGRRIAALGTEELVKEVVQRISENDKVKASISGLVQQQSLDLAGEAVDDLRQGTIDADNQIEALVWRLIGRTPPQPAKPAATAPRNDSVDGAKGTR